MGYRQYLIFLLKIYDKNIPTPTPEPTKQKSQGTSLLYSSHHSMSLSEVTWYEMINSIIQINKYI